MTISAEQMAIYQDTARQRRKEKIRRLEIRRRHAWRIAQQASKLLKEQFGVKKVVLFGSTCFPERFHQYSDVDLAVWGLDEKIYYRTVSYLLDLDPGIEVDIIEAEFASSGLLRNIEQEGIVI